jgi:hypothetical protein
MKKVLFAAVGAVALAVAGGAGASIRVLPDGGVSTTGATDALADTTVSLAAAAAASSPHTTFGSATEAADGTVTLDSSKGTAGVSFSIPSGLSVGDITDFSLDYSFANGCPNGVPRLEIITVRGPMYVSLGNAAVFSCAAGTRNSSSFLHLGTAADTGRILAGTFTDTWGHAKSEYDKLRVVAIQLSTSGANQTVVVSNMQLILNPRPVEPSM